MRNQAMKRKLDSGECIDLSKCQRTTDGDYILKYFVDGVDYCDAGTEGWIWSIGKNRQTGQILASTSNKFYSAGEDPVWECLWLR